MKLLEAFLSISNELTPMFSQERTARRAKRLLLSNLLCIGRHWLTRMLCVTNRDQRDWSADYRLFSRSPWKAQNLFEPVVRRSLEYADKDKVICLAGDETKFERAGRKVKRSRWMRDPLSPPFHTNFIKARSRFDYLCPDTEKIAVFYSQFYYIKSSCFAIMRIK